MKIKGKKPQLTNFDKEFFTNAKPRALTKGGIVGYHRQNHSIQPGTEVNTNEPGISKPWKKHFNRNKKEKLRRITSHFDNAEY